ncbi:ribosomal RNA large subunit methyltransferase M [Marinobacterium zhoushanense]|uniref:Ribosomal RNA large subunit methyltransferase M n=1 Tax=Marinobacterium zhoushanense TaxID=1679163 RepID=A0ABQ1KCN2_9GAMM|nr:23S rRNA (cytidine(2498)-2'-O)-methyltransferase RlmM [Marinobacterium zhoushanense]GGB90052.1 ribosomal RNA large subunit methyltransferase M [Marinobacterium zhoushanense]
MTQPDSLLLLCRAGFEGECAAELTELAAASGFYGYPTLERNAGFVVFHVQAPATALQLIETVRFRRLIFTRQWFACGAMLEGLDPRDRLTPVAERAAELPKCTELVIETADTTAGRELQGFGRKFASAVAPKLRQTDLLGKRGQKADWRLHLLVLSGRDMWLGVAPVRNSAPDPGGIIRLKFPVAAPSRSTLKLEEAWHWFIHKGQWEQRLAPGMRAVDLGAAPGGWTWQLVQRGMFVTSVDNGPMNPDLMETGQVEHLREDAFVYQPSKPVDWMVCDVVEKPARTTAMVIEWALNGWARDMIFNLKLPMKQRYAETRTCLERIEEALGDAGLRWRLQAKQLYHDREEITCWLSLER